MGEPARALGRDLRKRAKALVVDIETRERRRLRERVRFAQLARQRAVKRIRAWAKHRRIDIRDRAQKARRRCLERIRKAAGRQRELVRERKDLLIASANRKLRKVEAARVRELERELSTQRMIQERERKRVKGPTAKERAAESDDEVRSNLDRELVPVFNRVRRIIRGGPRRTRTEAFLEWVHEHPGDVLHMQAESAQKDVERLVAERHEKERKQARSGKVAEGFLSALWRGRGFELERKPESKTRGFEWHRLTVRKLKNGHRKPQLWSAKLRLSDNDWSLDGLVSGPPGDEALVRDWVDTLDGWSPLDDLSDVPF